MALCTRCGRQTEDTAEFCSGCGSYPGSREPERAQTVSAGAASAGYLRPFASDLGGGTPLRTAGERAAGAEPDSPPAGNRVQWGLRPPSPAGNAPDLPAPRSPADFAGNGGALDELGSDRFGPGGPAATPASGGFSLVPRGPFEPAQPAYPQDDAGSAYPEAALDFPAARADAYPDGAPYLEAGPAGGYPDPAPRFPGEPAGTYPDPAPRFPGDYPDPAGYFPDDPAPEPDDTYPDRAVAGYQPAPAAPGFGPGGGPLAGYPPAGYSAPGTLPPQAYEPAVGPAPDGSPDAGYQGLADGRMPPVPNTMTAADDLLAGPLTGYGRPSGTWREQAIPAGQPLPSGPAWLAQGYPDAAPQPMSPAPGAAALGRAPAPGYPPFPPEGPAATGRQVRSGRWISVAAAAVVLVVCAASAVLLLSHGKSAPRPRSTAAARAARPRPTAAPSPSGLITVKPAASGANAAAVVTFLTRYFTAINKHDFAAYRRLFGTSLRGGLSQAAFTRGYGTTQDSKATLHGITAVGSGEINAAVTFTSHQLAAASPNHSACTTWRISLYLVRQAGRYVLVSPPAGYQGSFGNCA